MSERAVAIGVVAALTLLALASCSKEKVADGPKLLGTLAGPTRPAAATPADSDGGDEATGNETDEGTTHHEAVDHAIALPTDGGASFSYTVNIHKEGGTAPDPDTLTLEEGRKAAGACFTGITDGSPTRSATIRLLVLPSGTVNRSEVSAPGTAEGWVLSCLEGVGSGLHFSDKPKADVRTFIVSAMVTRGH